MALESSIAESLAQAYASGNTDEVNRILQENQVTSGDVQSYWNFSPEQAASSGLSFYQPQATQTEAAQPPPVTDVNSFFAAGTQNQTAASSTPGALTTATSGASALPGVTGQDTTGQTGQPRFTDEQYASAGQFINQNLNNPAAIISAIDELNLTSEDVLRAARTVNPNITYDQIIGFIDAAPTGATTGALTAATNNVVLTDPTSGQGLSIPREDYEGMRALLQVAMGEQTPGYQVTDADIAQWVSRGGVNAILDAFPVFNTATGTAGAASSAGTSAPLSNLNTVLTGPDATLSSVRSAYDAALADPNLTAEQRAQLEQIGTSLTEAESRWGSLGVDPLQAENLYRQINAINNATGGGNWSGSWMSGGDNAAREAAIRLNRLGVDSLADLRVVPDYADATTVEFYRGQQVRRDESGNRYIFEFRSAGDSEQAYPVYLPPDAKVEYYSATTRNVIDPSESYSETSYAPLTEEELKTFDPETKTYKVRTFDKLIDASTGQKIANMSMGPAGPAFYIDQYETGNFLKGATKSFGIQIAPDGTPIPFTTTEKEGLVYSPILPLIASILMPGVGQALTSTISSALPGAAVAASGATSAIAATTFNTIASNALSNAIISGVTSELADGDFWDGFKSGLLSTTIGAGLNIGLKEVLPADFIKENPILARSVINATTAGISAAINGTDVGQAVLGAVVNTGVNAGAGALAGDMGLNEQQTKAFTGLITPIITSLVNTGRVSDQTILNAVMTAVGTAVKSGVTNPENANKPVAPTGTTGGTTSSVLFGGTDDPFFTAYSNAISAGMSSEEAAEAAGAIVNQPITTRVNDAFNQTLKETGDKNLALDAASQAGGIAVSQPVTGGTSVTGTDIGRQEDQGDWAGLAVAQDQATLRNTVNVANDQADTPQEALALVQSQNPTADSFTFGGQTYKILASNEQIGAQITANDIANASTFNEAYRLARDSLGPNKTFTWQGKEYSTATAEERPDLSGRPTTDAVGFNNEVRDYVANKLAQSVADPNFNPADLSAGSLRNFVNAYAGATQAQKDAMLAGPDAMTYRVIDSMLKETQAVNPTGTVTGPAAGSGTIGPSDKSFLSTTADVIKAAGNLAAADIAGVGTRVAQFVTQALGGDTATVDAAQNLLTKDKDKTMSQLVGNERAVAAGLASGIESAGSFLVAGPMGPVVTIGAIVANNSWQEGANKWIDNKGNVFDSREEARSRGITDVRQLTPVENGQRTAIMTAIEVAGELIGIPGMKQIMSGIPVTGSVNQIIDSIKNFSFGMGKEQASELLTTVAQFAVDKFASFGLSQNSTFEDFKTALADTVIATTAAVGGSSAIATSAQSVNNVINQATQGSNVSPVIPQTPDFGRFITEGSKLATLPADYFQGANPITQEQADFLKLDTQDRSIMDTIRNQAAGLVLSFAAATAPAITIDYSTPITQVSQVVSQQIESGQEVGSVVSTAISSGADVFATVNSAVNAAVTSGTNVSQATQTAINSAISSNAESTSAVSSAVNAAIQNGLSTEQAATVAQNAANSANANVSVQTSTNAANTVTTNVVTNTANNTQTVTVNNTENSTVTQTTTNTANNTVTQTVTNQANNTVTQTAINNATNTVTQTVTNTTNNTQTSVVTNTANNTQTTTVTNTSTGQVVSQNTSTIPPDWTPPVINSGVGDSSPPTTQPPTAEPQPQPPVTPPVVEPPVVTPTTPTITTTPKGGGGGGGGGPAPVVPPSVLMGGIGAPPPMQFGPDLNAPLNIPILKPDDPKFYKEKKIDPIQRILEAQSDFMNMPNIQQFQQSQQAMAPLAAVQAPAPMQPPAIAQGSEEAPSKDFYSYGVEKDIDTILGAFGLKEAAEGGSIRMAEGGYVAPLMMKDGGDMPLPLMSKAGGALSQYGGRENFKEGKHVAGEGDGQSDDIPAWLADGEFVFPADVVSALGNGSTKAGTDKLYEMMHGIRERARSKGPKDLPPPALKSPLDYLKSRKGAR